MSSLILRGSSTIQSMFDFSRNRFYSDSFGPKIVYNIEVLSVEQQLDQFSIWTTELDD